mgnify:CR=1 FL=1
MRRAIRVPADLVARALFGAGDVASVTVAANVIARESSDDDPNWDFDGVDANVAAVLGRGVEGWLSGADLFPGIAAAFGIPAPRVLRELTEFNHLLQSGRGDDLLPPRKLHRLPLIHPPFYAVAVKASMPWRYCRRTTGS